MTDLIVPHAYDVALLLSVAIVAATGGAWWSDRGWRRKHTTLKRRFGIRVGSPLDFYQALDRPASGRAVADDNIVRMDRRRAL